MLHKKNSLLSYLLKTPNWLLAVCGAIVWLYHQSLSFIPLGALLIKLLISPEWHIKPKQTLLKFTIAIIIFERIFIGAASNWYWEYSRGGAKFHMLGFTSAENMKIYLDKNYLNRNKNKLVYDAETAGATCIIKNVIQNEYNQYKYSVNDIKWIDICFYKKINWYWDSKDYSSFTIYSAKDGNIANIETSYVTTF